MWSWQTVALARQERGEFDSAGEALIPIDAHRDELKNPILLYNVAVISAQQAAATGDWQRLDREVSFSVKRLRALAELFGDSDGQIARERKDVGYLVEGRNRLREWGVLTGDGGQATDALKPADAAAIRALDLGASNVDSALLGPPWKQAFLDHLKQARQN
jgi:hypothetical protein